MTDKKINESILSEELKLSFLNIIDHFWISILFFSMPFLIILISINKPFDFKNERFIIILIVSFSISLFGYFLQKSKLKLKSVQTNFSYEVLIQKIESLAVDLNWELKVKKSNYFLFVTNPKLTSGSWGEQITVLIKGNRVYVNSVCDLNKRTSIVSFGRNKKNELAILQNIK